MIRHFIYFLLGRLSPTRFFSLCRWPLRCAGVEVAGDVYFSGAGWIYAPSRLVIGRGSWLSPSSVFYIHRRAPITIDLRCDIGPGIEFISSGDRVGLGSRCDGGGSALRFDVRERSRVSARTVISGGVRVSSGSVASTGSIVTRRVSQTVGDARALACVKGGLDR